MLAGSGDCIAFTSPSTIKNLARLFDTHDLGKILPRHRRRLHRLRHLPTAAAEYGLQRRHPTGPFTAKDLAQAIADYYSDHGSSA